MAAQKQTNVHKVDNEETFKTAFGKSEYAVLFFWADWHEPCKQIASVFMELSNDHPTLRFFSINAEQYESLTEQFNVSAVPTIVLTKQQKEVKRLEAETVPNTVDAINQFAQHSQTASALKPTPQQNEAKEESIEELNKRIAKLINAAPIMLFMKGTPEEPKCKFSRATIEILKQQNVTKFGYFNILNDQAVRNQIKVYSNWKTFPQLYINGKLIGGLDVIKEKIEDDEFQEMLPKETKNAQQTLNDRLKSLVHQKTVMLFMKGTPSQPQCGFSNQMIQLLKQQGVSDYGHFNILDDMEVRQGLKKYSNWPTYPQLYVKGQLLGGLDVVKEMIEDDEFQDAVNV
eukprot:CAMPEP_0197075540 /NCGR_PEP_ID=MMETSP1384-20130603/211663_1 /TAXON_ID=29189 /ORGANISM="Ammonia sp." /LENGTH=343 /DNA_ID=CAMNT_0042514389 /DNA_START=17 /DNA_END=1048 /DNA_ORIENTATION=+